MFLIDMHVRFFFVTGTHALVLVILTGSQKNYFQGYVLQRKICCASKIGGVLEKLMHTYHV
jgi:hypothetical protein